MGPHALSMYRAVGGLGTQFIIINRRAIEYNWFVRFHGALVVVCATRSGNARPGPLKAISAG
jgi:hypothetical protein